MYSMTQSFESGIKNSSRRKYIPDFCFSDKIGVSSLNRNDIESVGQFEQKASLVLRGTMEPMALKDERSSEVGTLNDQSDNETKSLKTVKNKPSGNFKPALQRTRFKQLLFPLSILFIGVVLYDEIDLFLFSNQMLKEC